MGHAADMMGKFKRLTELPFDKLSPSAMARQNFRAIEEIHNDSLWISFACRCLGISINTKQLENYTRHRLDKARDSIVYGPCDRTLQPLGEVLGFDERQIVDLRDNGALAGVQVHRVMDVYDSDFRGQPLPKWARSLYFLAPSTDTFTDEEVQQIPLSETMEDGEVLAGLLCLLRSATGKATPPGFNISMGDMLAREDADFGMPN